jgi:hypothetical protein
MCSKDSHLHTCSVVQKTKLLLRRFGWYKYLRRDPLFDFCLDVWTDHFLVGWLPQFHHTSTPKNVGDKDGRGSSENPGLFYSLASSQMRGLQMSYGHWLLIDDEPGSFWLTQRTRIRALPAATAQHIDTTPTWPRRVSRANSKKSAILYLGRTRKNQRFSVLLLSQGESMELWILSSPPTHRRVSYFLFVLGSQL